MTAIPTTITIYALYDDREPGKWRYVGQARNGPKRFSDHRRQMTAGIPRDNLQMAILAIVEAAQANEVERSFIEQFVKDGHLLANVKDNPLPIVYQYSHPIGPAQRPNDYRYGRGIGTRYELDVNYKSVTIGDYFVDAEGNVTWLSREEAKNLFWENLRADKPRMNAVLDILREIGRRVLEKREQEAAEVQKKQDEGDNPEAAP